MGAPEEEAELGVSCNPLATFTGPPPVPVGRVEEGAGSDSPPPRPKYFHAGLYLLGVLERESVCEWDGEGDSVEWKSIENAITANKFPCLNDVHTHTAAFSSLLERNNIVRATASSLRNQREHFPHLIVVIHAQ